MRALSLSLLLSVAVAAAPVDAAEEPQSASGAICGPTFALQEGENAAGTAFLLQRPGKTQSLLVTAHHLFGPDGGLEAQISWSDLPKAVSGVSCQGLGRPGWQVTAASPLAIENAQSYADAPNGKIKDLAVFAVKKATGSVLTLAAASPKVGDWVWLVAPVSRGAPKGQYLHRARVVSITSDSLMYDYDNTAISLSGTSGAPVVNAAGQVVGVNFGAGTPEGGGLRGFATNRDTLAAALEKLAP